MSAEINALQWTVCLPPVSALLGLGRDPGFMLLLSCGSPSCWWHWCLHWLYCGICGPRVQQRTRRLRERSNDVTAFWWRLCRR